MTDVTGSRLQAVVEAAQGRGERVVVVMAATTRTASLDAFARALDFPAWFGRNLDALADCLCERAPSDGGALHVVWADAGRLDEADPDGARGIRAVLRDVAKEHPTLHVTVLAGQ